MEIIKISDLKKVFYQHIPFTLKKVSKVALDGLSLSIKEGEIFGLVGPNGAGKTTLIKILSSSILPNSGTATICNIDINHAEKIKKNIGLITSEERSFYWRLTAQQNLNFFAALYNIRKERIDEVLDIVQLKDVKDLMVQNFSSGMKQRLAIARGLLHDPSILLLDEATKSLDPLAAFEFKKFIKEELVEKHKKTIVWTTHNLGEAETLCDQIAVINKGKLIALGSFEELKAKLPQDSPATLENIFISMIREQG